MPAKKARHGLFKHGKPPEYKSWSEIKQRCTNPKNANFFRYGGRGITICARWRDDFLAFLDDMGPRPSPKHSIDRIDNDGNYEPGNCRWATKEVQAFNRRSTVTVSLEGREMALTAYAREMGVSDKKLWHRHRLLGEPLDVAVQNIRVGRSRKLTEAQALEILSSDETQVILAARFGVSQSAVSLIRRGKNWSHLPAKL